MESEGVEAGWGVPTVWLGLLEEFKKRGRKPKKLNQILSGGSAVPQAMIDTFTRDYDIEVTHGWGMTEMSPVGTLTLFRPTNAPSRRWNAPPFPPGRAGACSASTSRSSTRRAIARHRMARPPASCSCAARHRVGLLQQPGGLAKQIDGEGWFATGDVAKITPDNWLLIVDRTKDLVKSGGEWISSIDVENAALACKGIAICAVIGVPHPKWHERPLLVVVKAPGANPTKAEILDVLGAKIAKWQMPDDVVFVDALPMTATGKISKKTCAPSSPTTSCRRDGGGCAGGQTPCARAPFLVATSRQGV
jgi:fatty-acyl-CoA synthase